MADELPNIEGDASQLYEARPVIIVGLLPQTWAAPGAAFDARRYSDVEVQIVGTPGVAYTPQRSLDGTNYVNANAYDASGTAYSTITAAGIYSLDGGGYLKLTGGSGSTVTVRASA